MSSRPAKIQRPSGYGAPAKPSLSEATIEEIIDRRLEAKLAERALNEKAQPVQNLPTDVQRRLDALEQRVSDKENSEGLQFLLMAKQHSARGEDASALKMYNLAAPFFPDNLKLQHKILALQDKVQRKRTERQIRTDQADAPIALPHQIQPPVPVSSTLAAKKPKQTHDNDQDDADYEDHPQEAQEVDDTSDDDFQYKFKSRRKAPPKSKVQIFRDENTSSSEQTPCTQHILRIINTRDLGQIRGLKGVGAKKAEAIVNCLWEMDEVEETRLVTDLEQLGALRGVGLKTVENMRAGLAAAV